MIIKSLFSKKGFFSFLFFLALVFLVGFAGAIFTNTSVNTWYTTLNKPSWNPPDWVFGPVWTLLYICIACSGWMIFIKSKARAIPFTIYGFQLVSNLLWSYCFFYLQNPGLALVDILILIILIGTNISKFIKIYSPAGLLLIPYFLWTLFAVFLNAAIWMIN